jgi:hypothetical protein
VVACKSWMHVLFLAIGALASPERVARAAKHAAYGGPSRPVKSCKSGL